MAAGGIEEREVYFAMPGIQAMVAYPMGSPAFTREVLGTLLERLVFDKRHVTEQLISQRWHILQQQNAQVLATMQIPNLTSRSQRNPAAPCWHFGDAKMSSAR